MRFRLDRKITWRRRAQIFGPFDPTDPRLFNTVVRVARRGRFASRKGARLGKAGNRNTVMFGNIGFVGYQ